MLTKSQSSSNCKCSFGYLPPEGDYLAVVVDIEDKISRATERDYRMITFKIWSPISEKDTGYILYKPLVDTHNGLWVWRKWVIDLLEIRRGLTAAVKLQHCTYGGAVRMEIKGEIIPAPYGTEKMLKALL